ncbi:polysaccharide deacetylase family protein [Anaerovorax odorimutans]|uniref:polysaccharide deacetylase family protein n=1 Tax=Anaerovorax odorimutans TaxID=109327 RepID=UPI0003FEF9CD|nr:polysaccharide deacetylase family protein [Anaerovorax odorimutans]
MTCEVKTKEDKDRNIKKLCIILGSLVIVIALGFFIAEQVINSVADAREKAEIKARNEKLQTELITKAEKLYKGYYYDEALALLNENIKLESKDDDRIKAEIAKIENAKSSLVKYEGSVEHVFFHSLIIYPELAFDDKGHPAEGYNMWMTTVSEFKKMLPELLKRGYVLYKLSDYIEMDSQNKIKLKDIYLPPGKIPLVISVDDVNYYEYMKLDGFAEKLVLDDKGRVSTQVVTPGGETKITRDGDVIPILDDYVAKHPEFSWRGAKGTIALTGYEGALGYRITDNLPSEKEDQQMVKKIADKMKENGWLFACHSYTHNGYFRTGKVTMAQMRSDIDEWKQKIEPWVGKTNIYISPFGYCLNNNDPRYRYIIESGFNIFCNVGNERKIIVNSDNIIMPRVNLDGFTMTNRKEEVNQHYFNVDDVIDTSRPLINDKLN